MPPGPAQKHPSRRARRNSTNVVQLPAEGYQGEVPTWPLQPDVVMSSHLEFMRDKIAAATAELAEAEDGRTKGRLRRQIDQLEMSEAALALQLEQATDAEVDLWELLWRDPQAAMWEKSVAFQRAVAVFVRWNIRAEQGDLKAATEARLRSADLGLTPRSLLALRREIAEADAAEDRRDERRKRRSQQPATNDSEAGKSGEDPRGGLYAV